MPTLDVNGTTLFYEDTGGSGSPLLFSHGLLWSSRMFEAQIAHFRDRYRCVAWDHRGQGQSADSPERSVEIETATADAIALIEALRLPPVHLAGLSMGGFVAMRIAARRPELVHSLILMETTAEPEPAQNVSRYRRLAFVARWFGLGLVADKVMPIMFSRSFLSDPARAAEVARWRAELVGNRRSIVRAVIGVIEREGILGEIGRIRAPTLVIVGEEDTATVPAKAELIVASIPGAALRRIPKAGHSSSVENPSAICAVMEEFLANLDGDPMPGQNPMKCPDGGIGA
jgi:3-oxoadipate enol-lactonase